ncbi:Centlein [Labeo rohita]|uniref:Centlein n=1 Tax=Labeo rohita TaxID=84645 RepID=A0ABQ8N0B1_LABRO|nr:Centlein [Labeo rohita]
MDSKDNERVLLLEEEVRSLSEELAQCQADKEFVWSLWKRLQVASPDLTQAVSLVVEREKQKAENKDRKVLEILQAKDYRIQELEQKVTAQEQEINNRVQQLRGSEEECGLMKKELAALQHRLGNKSRQLKGGKDSVGKKKKGARDQHQRQAGRTNGPVVELFSLELSLELKMAPAPGYLRGLQLALPTQEARRQAQECEEEGRRALQEARQQLDAQHSASQAELERLRDQEAVSSSRVKLSTVEREGADKEQQLCQIKHELQDLQCLYKQSVEHAGEQAQLIQQLEGLNLDTQRVLRSQEEAHTADTVSYQKLHSELSVSYQALWHSQEQLRQREAALSMQLSQRDQQIQELQAQLQSFTAAAGHCEVSPCGEHHDRFTSCSMPFVCKAS